MCKNISSKINCQSAIGQHLIRNPECAKTYTDDNFRIIGQARSSFHLGVLKSVYIKTENPVLCRQKEFAFSLKCICNEKFDIYFFAFYNVTLYRDHNAANQMIISNLKKKLQAFKVGYFGISNSKSSN